jgi:hypothetical protein
MILNADVLNVGQRCAFAQPTKPVSGQALNNDNFYAIVL